MGILFGFWIWVLDALNLNFAITVVLPSLPTLVLPSPPPSMTARVVGCRCQWQPTTPSSLQPWFSTIVTAFFSLGDVEREGKKEKEGREREREGDR